MAGCTDDEELPDKIELAIKQARSVGNRQSQLAKVEPITDTVRVNIYDDPAAIPIAQKKDLLDEYNDIIWHIPQLQTSVISYSDSYKKHTALIYYLRVKFL